MECFVVFVCAFECPCAVVRFFCFCFPGYHFPGGQPSGMYSLWAVRLANSIFLVISLCQKVTKNRFINIVLERVIEMLIIKEPHIYPPDNQKN
jgi:hypothetical protein